MAVNNTFGATALSSYGGFWISYAIILTPGGFEIASAYSSEDLNIAIGFYLAGWFIFTTILLVCTLRSTVAFFLLFFFLDIAFLLLMIGHLRLVDGAPNTQIIAGGGYFGLFAAFMAWYNALAGLADTRYAEHFPGVFCVLWLTYVSATPSSSFQSRTSPGLRRLARPALRPRARPFKIIYES